jgi:AraC family transcriptional regulator
MILRRFPGTGQGPAGEKDFSFFHRQNVVVYAHSRDISYEEHTAPLSLKSCLRGSEIYEVAAVPIAVGESAYLVLNNGQPYASYIYSDETVESFCLFFQDGLEKEVLAAFEQSHEDLLDNPEGHSRWSAPFFQSLRRHNQLVSPLLARLHGGIAAGRATQLWLDEQFGRLLEALLQAHGMALREAERLPLARRATRLEVYRRLCLARDYIESCYVEPGGLRELARVACLSPHHFLRLFKAAFRLTPHQYLTDVRLRHALRMVEEKELSVTDVCHSVGFEDAGSFTRLFKRRFGAPPLARRRAHQKS